MPMVATWNCNMAFRDKKARLLAFDPDILVIQECESPAVRGDWSEFTDWRWIGDNEHRGLGIFTRNGISLTPADIEQSAGRFTLPVETDSSVDILGVWAMNDSQTPENRYIGQVCRTLRAYEAWLDSNTVVLGDFNWNVIWDDSPDQPLVGDFSETMELLRDHGLRSVYHTFTDAEFGAEADSTFHMHKKRERGYHTDYIFAPDETLQSDSEHTVGEYDEWIDASDHMPMVVEL